MPEVKFQQGDKKRKQENTPQQPGSGTRITNFIPGTIPEPVVTNLADADSIITQPKYNNLSRPINTEDPRYNPKDLIGAVKYLEPKIKAYMGPLNSAFAEYKANNPTATKLPYDESVKAVGGPTQYKDFLDHAHVYSKYRGKTTLDPRNATGEWGMQDTFGDSNSGGGIRYGETTPYDSTLMNLFAPYTPAQKTLKFLKK